MEAPNPGSCSVVSLDFTYKTQKIIKDVKMMTAVSVPSSWPSTAVLVVGAAWGTPQTLCPRCLLVLYSRFSGGTCMNVLSLMVTGIMVSAINK